MDGLRSCPDLLPQARNLRVTLAGEETGRVPRQEFFLNNPGGGAFIEGVEEAASWQSD